MPRSNVLTLRAMQRSDHIPKLIHQTFGNGPLPEIFARNIDTIKTMNPGWQHFLYDDNDIIEFISAEYGSGVLDMYRRINPHYGAARADFFRYLLLYRYGGVYLDIKSTTTRPLDESLRVDDQYILSHWRNERGTPREGWGIHPELAVVEFGEFQQWHVICAPGHPFLRAVIQSVFARINAYRPWRERLGQQAVIRVTGPIPYTLAILPLLACHPHRLVRTEEEVGLSYSVLPDFKHSGLFKNHYVRLLEPLIEMKGVARTLTQAYLCARRARDRLASWRRTIRALLRGDRSKF